MWSRKRLLLVGLASALLAVAASAVGAFFSSASLVRHVTLTLGMLGLVGVFAFIGGGLWAKGGRRDGREESNGRS